MGELIPRDENEILLETAQGQPVLVRYSPTTFEVLGNDSGFILSTASRNLLRITVAQLRDSLAQRLPVTIAALATNAGNLVLWKKDFWISADAQHDVEEWAERVINLAYGGTPNYPTRVS